ncbi:MAG: EAL domain-containing protein [Nitrosomonadales bacterium]|nr:EAL domain-containing protein [Nitrosomonadales bacterium]
MAREGCKLRVSRIFTVVRPFISAFAVVATAAALVFTMYFTQLGLQWTTFLYGILVAAILAEATRVTRAEWVAMRRTAQLRGFKEKLERETQLRKKAEEANAAGKLRLHLIDEALPTMVAFVDIEGRCQYCNRAFIEGLRLRPEQVNGRHMREVLGARIYQETATAVRQSLDGHPVHYERTQKMPDGAFYRLSIAHIPEFGENGKVVGFHMLINDITAPSDVHPPGELAPHAQTRTETAVHVQDGNAVQDMYVDSFSEQIAGRTDVKQIMAAIENGNFHLFCQLITPLSAGSGEAEHYEILIRLMEEEESMMPPGAFFPLAEKFGLMQHLDRWVVRHVTEWASHQNPAHGKQDHSMFFINISSATIGDPGFPEFLQLTLLEHQVRGAVLCFEIPNAELASRALLVAEFARRVSQCGCCVAISGFGRDRILFDLIQGFQVDFLKIDGSIVFGMLRNSVDLAKIMAINGVAKKMGIKTIAELAESEETIAKLKEIGIDLAQGFGISRPRPLIE